MPGIINGRKFNVMIMLLMRMKDKCRRNYPRGRSRASKGVNPQSLYQQGYYSCSMVTLAKLMGDPKSVK
jgi:hypothetical protein